MAWPVASGPKASAAPRASARTIEAGTIWINTYKQSASPRRLAAFKQSGIGHEKGVSGLRLYQQSKSVYLGLQVLP